jgi:hypothetical protein
MTKEDFEKQKDYEVQKKDLFKSQIINYLTKIWDIIKVVLTTIFLLWVFYVAIPYRFGHPELTETQLQMKIFSMGSYDPLKKD